MQFDTPLRPFSGPHQIDLRFSLPHEKLGHRKTEADMPSSRIATGEWARGREMELITALQAALESSIKIPDWDRDVVVDIYRDDERITPPNCSTRYTRIEIALYAGRSMDAKRALYKAIVQNLEGLGVPEGDIKTILIEFPLQDCAPRGALAASDSDDLGYKVAV